MTTNTEVATVTPAPAPVTPAAYNAVVASARLRDIRLVESSFNLDPEVLENNDGWKHSHSCVIQQSYYQPEENLLVAWIAAEASCLKQRKTIVAAKCRYLVVYHVDGNPDAAVVDAFAKRVARFAAYPYFRSHFAELASQAGVYLPPLPIIKERKILPTAPKKDDVKADAEQPDEAAKSG